MSQEIRLVADYHSAYNEIVQPDLLVYQSRYYVRRWKPLLGGNGDMIVMALRSLGYYNRETGEKRDGIPINLAELAKLCRLSIATLKREFGSKADGSPANPALLQFVQREKNYRRDKVTGQIWREENIYRVMMDDPIHPDDLPRLQEILEQRQKGASPSGSGSNREAKPRKAQSELYGSPSPVPRRAQNEPPIAQNELGAAQIELPMAQSDSKPNQNELTLSPTLSFLEELISPVPTAPLLPVTGQEAEVQKIEPLERQSKSDARRGWLDLTEAERQSWLRQAVSELAKYAQEAGADVWARIGPRQEEVRARHLYEATQPRPK